MNDAALYQRLRRAPLISMWGKKKTLNFRHWGYESSVYRYYNGTLLHVAHICISHTHWVRVGHWHGWYMARPPPTPHSPIELALWSLNLNLEWGKWCRELARLSLIKPLIYLWCRQEQHCKQTNQGRFIWWSSGGTTGDLSTTWFLRYFRFQTDFHIMASCFQNLFPRWMRTQFTVVYYKNVF